MQYRNSFIAAAALASTVFGAAINTESSWTTLTAPSPAPSGAITDYASTFGIAVIPLSESSSSIQKRDVITQIGDGQIQATTTTKTTATAEAVSQIGDGQIQATTKTTKAAKTEAAVSQIGDGQIQATTATTSTEAAVSQIGDGQIQATTKTTSTGTDVSQISDGQIQASTTTSGEKKEATSTTSSESATSTSSSDDDRIQSVSCKSPSSLAMTLHDGILTDSKGRIGSIVANRQFQFDGPPPQAGAIYAKGWSITEEGNLAIGNETTFYQCLSGTFYNLYDKSIGGQCHPIHLQVVKLVDC